MTIHEMTKKDFENVPYRERYDKPLPLFSSLVIIPTSKKHDSGWRCIEVVGVNANDEPVVKMAGCSDVLNIDGIGGFGDWRPNNEVPKTRPIESWSIDCLPKSGYFRLFCNGTIKCGHDLSSFEIFWHKKELNNG